jgi:hypothetical protein
MSSRRSGSVGSSIGALEEVFRQLANVFAAFGERRELDRHDVDPVEEIGAKPPAGDVLLQVAVRRGDHAHVDVDGRRSTHALHPPFLERAQKLRLDPQGEICDLVEEKGAAARGLEFSDTPLLCVREGAAFVAEELALDQAFRNRCAVHRDEAPAAALTEVVDGAGGELLSGAARAVDQHRGARPRDLPNGLEDLLHALAAPEELAQALPPLDLRPQARDLVLEGAVIEELLDLDPQRVDLEGLGDVVRGAVLHRLHRGRDGLGGREDDDGRRTVRFGDCGEEVEAATAGHDEVQQDEIRRRVGDRPHPLVHAVCGDDLAVVLEKHPQRLAHSGLVVDHQHPRHRPNVPKLSAADHPPRDLSGPPHGLVRIRRLGGWTSETRGGDPAAPTATPFCVRDLDDILARAGEDGPEEAAFTGEEP